MFVPYGDCGVILREARLQVPGAFFICVVLSFLVSLYYGSSREQKHGSSNLAIDFKVVLQ